MAATQSKPYQRSPMNQSIFQSEKLQPKLREVLAELKFLTPTPIQALAIPHALEKKDVMAQAATGTGKTLAFLIPLINKHFLNRESKALIVLPTRELVTQVLTVLNDFSKFGIQVHACALTGGTSMIPQFRQLKKNPRIIVATPGRLIDHLERRSLSLEAADYVVLDEADRMLDMGFAPQIKRVLQSLPRNRQTMLFSATFPKEILSLAESFQRSPVKVTAEPPQKERPLIDQSVRFVVGEQKNTALIEELDSREGSILVFARTQLRTERAYRFLKNKGYAVEGIHGGLRQNQRTKAMSRFRDKEVRILVATDVAARGIDIDHVNHVINYDLPQFNEDYIHRIGRTGRAGRKGSALTFVFPEEHSSWNSIARLVKKELLVDLPMAPGRSSQGGNANANGSGGSNSRSRGRGGRPSFGGNKRSGPQGRQRFSGRKKAH